MKKTTRARTACSIDGCDNDAVFPKIGLCQACYSGMYYWTRKPPGAIVKRARKLKVFEARLDALNPVSPRLSVNRRRAARVH